MTTIGQFLKGMQHDVQHILARRDATKPMRDQRIVSVALRVLGIALVALAAWTLLAGIMATNGTAVKALYTILSAIVYAVAGHDFAVVGSNRRLEIESQKPSNFSTNDLLTEGTETLHKTVQVSDIALSEATRKAPYALQGTWLFEPIYTCKIY